MSEKAAWVVVGTVCIAWLVVGVIVPSVDPAFQTPPAVGTAMGALAGGAVLAAMQRRKNGKGGDTTDDDVEPSPPD